jgi:hypothetical protein
MARSDRWTDRVKIIDLESALRAINPMNSVRHLDWMNVVPCPVTDKLPVLASSVRYRQLYDIFYVISNDSTVAPNNVARTSQTAYGTWQSLILHNITTY